MGKSFRDKRKGPTQRQLKVGEEIRHALSDVFLRNETSEPELDRLSLTVSEVRISPDLRNATAYIAPLGSSEKGQEAIDILARHTGAIRRSVTSRVHLKYSPTIRFRLDQSFDEAQKIDRLLKQPEVARDLRKGDGDEAEQQPAS